VEAYRTNIKRPCTDGDALERAGTLRELGRFGEAISVLQEAADREPTIKEVRLTLARLLKQVGRLSDSIEVYRGLAAADPHHFTGRIELGNLLRESEAVDDAEHVLTAVVHEAPDNVGGLNALATVFWKKRQFEAAKELFQKAVTLQPSNIGALQALEMIAREEGDDEAALGWLERMKLADALPRPRSSRETRSISEDPAAGHCAEPKMSSPTDHENALASLKIAEHLRSVGSLSEAESIYRGILRVDGTNLAATIALGQIKKQFKDLETSLDLFRQAERLSPQHCGVKLEIGGLLRELGRLDQAEAAVNAVLEEDPNNFEARVGLAHIKRRRGDRHSSLAEFEIATKLNPRHLGLKLEKANDLRELSRLDQAEAVVNAVLAEAPNNFEAHVGLAHIKRRRGDRQGSSVEFEIAAKLNPTHPGLKLEIANDLRELGRLDSAEAVVKDVLGEHPNNFEAHVGMAHIKRRLGDRVNSLVQFEVAAKLNPRHPGLKLEIANDLRELSRLDSAEAVLKDVLKEYPNDYEAHVGMAHLKRRRGDRLGSLAEFEIAAKLNPKHSGIKLEMANDLRELGRMDTAQAVVNDILEEYPNNFEARIGIAHIKRRLGDRLGSLAEFEVAAQLNPGHFALRLEMANDLRELGRLDAAEAIVKEIIEEDPNNLEARVGMALIKRRQGNRKGALAEFEIAVKLNPTHPGIKLEIANDLRELGRLDQAEAVVNAVLAEDPNNFEARVGLAHIKRRRGDRQSSLAEFEIAAKLNPGHATLRLEVTNDLRELGRLDQAEAILTAVLEKHPENVNGHIGIALIKRRKGDRRGSLSALLNGQTIDPKHLDVKLEIVSDLQELGLIHEAESLIKSVLDLDPTYARAYGALGTLYRVRGEFEKAKRAFQAAAERDPGNLGFRVEHANCARELGHIAEADVTLRTILSEHPHHLQASISLSVLLIEAYCLDQARHILEAVYEAEPRVDVLLMLGRLHRRADQRLEALRLFMQARTIEPENRAASFETIEEYRALGKFKEAEDLNEDLARRDSSLVPLLYRGRIFRDKGEHHFALQAFAKARDTYPEATQVLLELAVQHRLMGQPQESARIIESLSKNSPRQLAIIDQIIEHLRIGERFEEALEKAVYAIELRPNLHQSYLKAAQMAARLGRNQDVSAFLNDAEQYAGPHPEINATRIELLRFARKLRDAEALFLNLRSEEALHFPIIVQAVECAISLGKLNVARKRAALLQPQTAASKCTTLRLEGKILEAAGDHPGALDKYEAALPLAPNDPGIHHELARCNLLMFKTTAALKHHKKSHKLSASANMLRKSSHNSSQNHMGQLIDEFLLDRQLVTELERMQSIDIAEKLTRLYTLVIDHPDNLAPSIALLLELRRAGLLTFNRKNGTELHIPRSIVQFWDEAAPPDEISELSASWRSENPDFSYKLFNDETARRFLKQNHSHDTYVAFCQSREPAQKADLFRLAYLVSRGGFYADCDDRCAMPLQRFIPAKSTFVAYQEEYGTLGNNFIGATSDHPVVSRALKLAVDAINRGDRDMIWLLTGPGLLTRAFASVVARNPEQHLSNAAIFTAGKLQRGIELHCPLAYKLTNRHWLKSSFLINRAASTNTDGFGQK
jgi:tetratricopeptide (TPR) repeat protein